MRFNAFEIQAYNIYSPICSAHLLEPEITCQTIGVSPVTRHSVTLLLVVLLCGK